MKVALCISGQARTFKKCYQSFLDNIIKPYNCDVFMFIKKDESAINMDLIESTKKIIEEDQILDEKDYMKYKTCTKHISLQSLLRQVYGIKRCNDLMLNYQNEKNIHYDWVIRSRADLLFVKELPSLSKLDNKKIYMSRYPWLDQKHSDKHYPIGPFDFKTSDCLPDMFAFSSPELMTIYSNRWDVLYTLTQKIGFLYLENSICQHLKFNSVKVDILDSIYYVPDKSKYAKGYPKNV